MDAKDRIMMDAGRKINFLTALAYKLNGIIGEDITSSELRVTLVDYENAKFEKTSMSSEYDEGKPGEAVICTTELGLGTRKGVEEYMLLLKPRVALEGFFCT